MAVRLKPHVDDYPEITPRNRRLALVPAVETMEGASQRRARAVLTPSVVSRQSDDTDVSPPPGIGDNGGPSLAQSARYDLLTDKQRVVLDLLTGGQRHTCVVGGSRSGKTTLICRLIIIRALKAKSRHAILRFRGNAVWPSIGMDTFPKVMRTFFPGVNYRENKALHYFEFENGSQIWLGGLDDKERTEKILGNEYSTIFFNECSQIPYSSILVALSRLAEVVEGLEQRAYYDLNPSSTRHWTNLQFGDMVDPVSLRPMTPETRVHYARAFMNPKDNTDNLTPEYLQSLDNMPERHKKRFRDGIYVDEADNALWKLAVLEANKRNSTEVPRLVRIVVAVDPSGAKNDYDTTHDAIGIVVAGLGDDGHVYVLADLTMLGGPDEWARCAISAYDRYRANEVIAEINYGGAMVEFTLRAVNQAIPFKAVTATRGKSVRADPVAALYDQGKVHHVMKAAPASLYGMAEDGWARLEEEQQSFTTLGYVGAASPNRADALVWAVTDLALQQNAAGWMNYYGAKAEGKTLEIPEGMSLSDVMRYTRAAGPALDANGQPIIDDSQQALRSPDGVKIDIGVNDKPATVVMNTSPHAAYFVPDLEGRTKKFTADEAGHIVVVVAEHGYLPALENAGCSRL